MKEIYGTSTPVMALRGISVFPQMVYSFDAGREKSIRALDEAMNGDQQMILRMQKDVSVDEPGPDDLYEVGVLVHIRQIRQKCPATRCGILAEGLSRIHMTGVHPGKSLPGGRLREAQRHRVPYFRAQGRGAAAGILSALWQRYSGTFCPRAVPMRSC